MPASKYKPEYPEIAAALYRRGADAVIVAEVLGIARRTLSDWRKRYPEFAASCCQSKALADSRVEAALYRRACGYEYEEVTWKGGKVTKIVTKEVVPDRGAIMSWLCNRRPDLWRHAMSVEHTGPGGGPIRVAPLSEIDSEITRLEAQFADSPDEREGPQAP